MVELNNGIWFNDVIVHDITFFDIEEVVTGGWFHFSTPEYPQYAIIGEVDFDDIYEIEVT